MGTIKFEIDLPEFEKELSINVTIHRDGEVVYSTTSSPSMGSIISGGDNGDLKKKAKKNEEKELPPTRIVDDSMAFPGISSGIEETSTKESKPKIATTKKRGGNFMDLDI